MGAGSVGSRAAGRKTGSGFISESLAEPPGAGSEGGAIRLASRRFRHRMSGRSRRNQDKSVRERVTVTATTTRTA